MIDFYTHIIYVKIRAAKKTQRPHNPPQEKVSLFVSMPEVCALRLSIYTLM